LKKQIIILGLLLILMSSCGPSPEVIAKQTADLAKETARQRTKTPMVTPTTTPTPTSTATQTQTLTPTQTSTSTETETPTPFSPIFSNLELALNFNQESHEARSPQNVFPVGISQIALVIEYKIPERTKLHYFVYQGEEEIVSEKLIYLDPERNKTATWMKKQYGFQEEGIYEVRIEFGEELIFTHQFEIKWIPTLWPVDIGTDIDIMSGKVKNAGTEFPSGTKYLFAAFDTVNFEVGDKITSEWWLEGELYQRTDYTWYNEEWSLGRHADKLTNQINEDEELPPGSYEFRAYVNGELKQTSEFVIK
jgi:hypothetical protein